MKKISAIFLLVLKPLECRIVKQGHQMKQRLFNIFITGRKAKGNFFLV